MSLARNLRHPYEAIIDLGIGYYFINLIKITIIIMYL